MSWNLIYLVIAMSMVTA